MGVRTQAFLALITVVLYNPNPSPDLPVNSIMGGGEGERESCLPTVIIYVLSTVQLFISGPSSIPLA